jgi:hypothetical protein
MGVAFAQQFFRLLVLLWRIGTPGETPFSNTGPNRPDRRFADIAKAQPSGSNEKAATKKAAAFPPRPFEN